MIYVTLLEQKEKQAADLKTKNNSKFGSGTKTDVCVTICCLAEHMLVLYDRGLVSAKFFSFPFLSSFAGMME